MSDIKTSIQQPVYDLDVKRVMESKANI